MVFVKKNCDFQNMKVTICKGLVGARVCLRVVTLRRCFFKPFGSENIFSEILNSKNELKRYDVAAVEVFLTIAMTRGLVRLGTSLKNERCCATDE